MASMGWEAWQVLRAARTATEVSLDAAVAAVTEVTEAAGSTAKEALRVLEEIFRTLSLSALQVARVLETVGERTATLVRSCGEALRLLIPAMIVAFGFWVFMRVQKRWTREVRDLLASSGMNPEGNAAGAEADSAVTSITPSGPERPRAANAAMANT